MPLLRAMERWIRRRTDVSEPYVPSNQWSSGGDSTGGIIWLGLVIVSLPVLAFLAVIGLIYEVVIRIDGRRRLGAVFHWGLAVAFTLVLAGALIVAALNISGSA